MTRYELLDRIGVGGMAEIFRGKAVAAGGFEKPVAIKRILPHLCQDTRFVELLIAEAKILSQLRHRNIVQIFDVGLGDDGQYFLVMEFVDGTDMGAIQRMIEARRRRLPLDLVLHVGAEICEALEHAHLAKAPDGQPMRLVHRDVSPSNVMVSRAGEIKLTDFGIAKRAEDTTGHGAVRGKFAYISPEQARNEPVDSRSDVFSVGVLLYEMCLGRRLFSALPDMEALRSVREVRVPRPSEVDPDLPSSVEELLLSTLARDPAQRPQTAGQLGSRLRTLRYSLEEAAGDPATELGKIVEGIGNPLEAPTTRAGRPRSNSNPFEAPEPTVLRIRTADAFQDSDGEGTAVLKARQLLERFEEEETRMSRIGTDPRARLRDLHETGEMTAAATPSSLFDHSDEATTVASQEDINSLVEESTSIAGTSGGRRGSEPQPRPRGKSRRQKATSRPPPIPGPGGGSGSGGSGGSGGRSPGLSPARDVSFEPTSISDPAWQPNVPPPSPVGGRMPLAPGPSTPSPPGGSSVGPGPMGYITSGLPGLGGPSPAAAAAMPMPPAGRGGNDRFDPTGLVPPPPAAFRAPAAPRLSGFAHIDEKRRTLLLVVGAVITGILGFAITRAIIGGDEAGETTATDAAPAGDAAGALPATGSGTGSVTPATTVDATTPDAAPPPDAKLEFAGSGSGDDTGNDGDVQMLDPDTPIDRPKPRPKPRPKKKPKPTPKKPTPKPKGR